MTAQRAFPKPVYPVPRSGPRPARPAYPGKVAIRHAIQAARDNGLDVAGVEVAPDGTIRILEARAMPAQTGPSLFDQLDAAGKL